MHIGFFDSGIGGIAVAKSVVRLLPQYSYRYFADDTHMPYGNKSKEVLYDLTTRALRTLFEQDCALVILACNSASTVLPRIQKEWLPAHFPDRTVLGVIRPTAEDIAEKSLKTQTYILATPITVEAQSFAHELTKIGQKGSYQAIACPGLAEAIENTTDYLNDTHTNSLLKAFLARVPLEKKITLYTGCTHYAFVTDSIRKLRPLATVRNQGKIVCHKFADYLRRHPELEERLTRVQDQSIAISCTSMDVTYIKKLQSAFQFHFSRI